MESRNEALWDDVRAAQVRADDQSAPGQHNPISTLSGGILECDERLQKHDTQIAGMLEWKSSWNRAPRTAFRWVSGAVAVGALAEWVVRHIQINLP